MAKGAAGAAQELEELQPAGDPVEEYQEKLVQLAQLLDDGSTEERVRAAYTMFRIASRMRAGEDEEDGGLEEEGDDEEGARLGGTQKVLVAQIAAELTLDPLITMWWDSKRELDALRAQLRSRAGGPEFDAAQRIHRNCDAAIAVFKQFRNSEIADMILSCEMRLKRDRAFAEGQSKAADEVEAKEAEAGLQVVKPTKTSAYVRTKMGQEADGPGLSMYDLTQDEFEYDSELDSEGEAEGLEVDAGVECCGFFCKIRSGLCCGMCSRGMTIKSLLRRFGKAVTLLLALPLLSGPILVLLLYNLLTAWEAEGKKGTLDELDTTIALTATYLVFHIALYLIGSFNGLLKRNRHTRVKHTAVVLGCLLTLIWGARLRLQSSDSATNGPDSESLRQFFRSTVVVMGVVSATNLWLLATATGVVRGGPYKPHRRATVRCCGPFRMRKIYVLDVGECAYTCNPCRVMYRNNEEGMAMLEEDMGDLERTLSKLLMMNQDQPKVKRQVRYYKKELRKYKREVARRRREANRAAERRRVEEERRKAVQRALREAEAAYRMRVQAKELEEADEEKGEAKAAATRA